MRNIIASITPLKFSAVAFILFVIGFSCSFTSKEKAAESDEAAQAPSWSVTVTGKVATPQPGKITIAEVKNGSFGWQDTIKLKSDGSFSKKVKLTQPGYYKLNFFDRQVVDVILYKSNIQVNVDGSDPNGFIEVNGSPEIEVIRKVQTIMREGESSPEIARLNGDFQNAVQSGDQKKMLAIQEEYAQVVKKSNDKVAELLRNEAPSLGVINLLQGGTVLDKDQYFDVYVAVANKLQKEWPNYDHAKTFISLVNTMKTIAIGQKAPEIALPDTTGKVVKLSSLQGKYVLVDFWAKWCGPCRQENPNVVRVFNKYKDKGFTVYGVSLDRRREDWIRAIGEDRLTWTHVSDLKYWQSEAAKTYNITGIPFSLLLDPKGVIIAKNLRGPALEKKLAEIFDTKTN